MIEETFIIGDSEDMEAEYGVRTDSAVTVIGIYNGGIFITYGAASKGAARAELLDNGAAADLISYV